MNHYICSVYVICEPKIENVIIALKKLVNWLFLKRMAKDGMDMYLYLP